MKNKKLIAIIAALVVFGGITLSWLFGWGVKKEKMEPNTSGGTSSSSQRKAITKIELEKSEEPEIELSIENDRSGATLTVSQIPDKFSDLEYELIYLAYSDDQEIERGVAGGPLVVSGGRVSEEMLFGTESCTTGTCRRHIDKNVSAGTLIVRLLTSDDQVWSSEKEFTIEKDGSGYKPIWKD